MTFPVLSSGGADPTAPIYPVQRSVRLQGIGSARFARTFSTPTSQNIFTWSAWVKRGTLSTVQHLFGAGTNNSFGFAAGNTLVVTIGGVAGATTAGVWRDPGAWYHIMYTQNGTAQTIYLNGVSRATATATNTTFNTAVSHLLGASNTTTPANFFDGVVTLAYFIDGQALTPTSFGRYSPGTNVWEPIKYTGTFGNNGSFLQFLDNSGSTATTLGKDTSGNGNNWTPSNINTVSPTNVNYDSLTDVPTNTSFTAANFPVINKLSTVTTATPNSANLQTTSSASQVLIGSMRMDTGKYYWEITFSAATSNQLVGVYKTTATTVTLTPTTNVIGVRFDANAGTLDYTTNGSSYTSIATGLTGGGYFPYASNTLGAKIIYINFGQRPFTYTVPSGYALLNTVSLSNTLPNSAKAFAATAYAGTNAANTISNSLNGSSFQPDIVWGKSRTNALDNAVYDSLRGVTKQLITNSTAAQTTQTTGLTAFTTSGFSMLQLSTLNGGANNYYAFQWKAGGATTSWNFDGTLNRSCTVATGATTTITLNTNGFSAGQAVQFTGSLPTGLSAGTTYYAGGVATNTFNVYDTEANAIAGGATGKIVTSGSGAGMACYHASKISANRQTGVSIISYVGVGANTTVGHGLGAVVDCAIIKAPASATSWPVYHKGMGNTSYMFFSGTGTATADSTYWNNTTPTSSVISLGTSSNLNGNGISYIMYAFATVPGFSSFEGYTGDGATDGLFLYTGFKPRFSIFKQTNVARSWITLNSSGQTYNVEGPYLFVDAANAEGTSTTLIDFVSNGIKHRSGNANTNANTGLYVYMAWAESPFKFSVAG